MESMDWASDKDAGRWEENLKKFLRAEPEKLDLSRGSCEGIERAQASARLDADVSTCFQGVSCSHTAASLAKVQALSQALQAWGAWVQQSESSSVMERKETCRRKPLRYALKCKAK